jgi:hypothetical protein
MNGGNAYEGALCRDDTVSVVIIMNTGKVFQVVEGAASFRPLWKVPIFSIQNSVMIL